MLLLDLRGHPCRGGDSRPFRIMTGMMGLSARQIPAEGFLRLGRLQVRIEANPSLEGFA